MTTVTASKARAGLNRLIDQTAESHQPVVISGKRSNAVLVSEEDWSTIKKLYIYWQFRVCVNRLKTLCMSPLLKVKGY